MNRLLTKMAIFLLIIFALPILSAPLENEDNPVYKGKKIDIVMNDADIRKVFLFFGECAGINMVIKGDVSGRITLKLKNVPWDQAFYILLDLFELKAEFVNDTLVIGRDT